MAEWLRPRISIAENGLNIRRISVGSISCPSKKTIGWAAGVKITSRRYYGWHRPNFRGQDGRVVKARDFGRYSRLSCVGSNLDQILITKKSPQGRVVPKSRPLVTVAGVSQI
jgi:hypothetical protein